MTNWSSVLSASGTGWNSVLSANAGVHSGQTQGSPIGLLLSLTYQLSGTIWTDVTKASGTSWTSVLTAT